MRSLAGLHNAGPLRGLVGDGMVIGTSFTTNGSGVPTILYDAQGSISVAQATNTYTISFPGSWVSTVCCVIDHQNNAVTYTKTITPSAGTVAIAFSGAFNGGRCDVFLVVTPNARG